MAAWIRRGRPERYDEFNIAQRAGNFGWPFLIGYNLGYRSYDYGAINTGRRSIPARPVNLSPRNTGIRELTPALRQRSLTPMPSRKNFPS